MAKGTNLNEQGGRSESQTDLAAQDCTTKLSSYGIDIS